MPLISFIDDITFSFVSICTFIVSTFLFNYGVVRWYAAVTGLIGFTVYRFTLSRLVIVIMVYVINFSKELFGFMLIPLKFAAVIFNVPRIKIYRTRIKHRLECEINKLARIR